MSRINTLFIAIILIIGPQLKSFAQNHPSSFADLAEKLMPSVVNISTTTMVKTQTNPFPFQFPPGSPFEDMFKEFGTPQERPSAALGSGIGNPFGLGGTVTSGIISARNRSIGLSRYEDYIQTDASINQGNSGGPLFDMNGNVIGINTAILGRNGSIGIGFSIPSNSAKIVIDQLVEFGETKRGWLGVRIQDVTKEIAEVEKLDKPRGALVASVAENSPSAKAGVKAGDIILEFDGEKINQMKELPMIVARTAVGKKVEVKIWRNKKEIVKIVTLGRLETSEDFKVSEKTESPKETEIKDLKITVRQINKEDIKSRNLPNQTSGLVVTKMANDSPLLNSLEVNSIILEAQKKKIRNVNDLNQIVKQVLNSNQKTILLVIYNSQNQRRYIGVKLD